MNKRKIEPGESWDSYARYLTENGVMPIAAMTQAKRAYVQETILTAESLTDIKVALSLLIQWEMI